MRRLSWLLHLVRGFVASVAVLSRVFGPVIEVGGGAARRNLTVSVVLGQFVGVGIEGRDFINLAILLASRDLVGRLVGRTIILLRFIVIVNTICLRVISPSRSFLTHHARLQSLSTPSR